MIPRQFKYLALHTNEFINLCLFLARANWKNTLIYFFSSSYRSSLENLLTFMKKSSTSLLNTTMSSYKSKTDEFTVSLSAAESYVISAAQLNMIF